MLDYICSKNKNKSPIIIIHGIASNADSFKAQIKELKNKYYVIALNLPGYGKSKFIKNASIKNYALIVYNFIINKNFKLPILVGHSLGGMIVQELIITYPKLAKACVLLGTSSRFGSQNPKWQKNFINSRIEPIKNGMTMKQISFASVSKIVANSTSKSKVTLAANIMSKISEKAYISDYEVRFICNSLFMTLNLFRSLKSFSGIPFGRSIKL